MSAKLANITIDCGDSKALASFYYKLLGGELKEAWGCPYLASANSDAPGLLFVQEDDYVAPVWPEEEGKQQKSLHLDFVTDEYEESIAAALELGAVKASLQVAPDHFTVLLDPAGHPFCMCRMSE
ncbi:MAG: VOC family protein [Oscillospiraceae bacterium]|jgi:hypothetical protein|nr:VOC family protein [Oscillospiraceae bacterium]